MLSFHRKFNNDLAHLVASTATVHLIAIIMLLLIEYVVSKNGKFSNKKLRCKIGGCDL